MSGNYRRALCVSENCGRLRQALYLLHYPQNTRELPECSDGTAVWKRRQDLAEQGVKELILVAQETTLYGRDIYGEKSLHKLLRELCRIKGIRWIRILYCYPEEIDDNLIQVMKEESKICHYLDLPIQHANNEILKRMGRRTSKEQLIAIIEKLREADPGYHLADYTDHRIPGGDERATRRTYGVCGSDGI